MTAKSRRWPNTSPACIKRRAVLPAIFAHKRAASLLEQAGGALLPAQKEKRSKPPGQGERATIAAPERSFSLPPVSCLP
nr:hypothetical protein [uncultured Ottowia sp.]